ncbi:hypothetical protein ILYODFUR_032760 [Ilyodon furcidens]|uniref:Uncharacterized protein n=1 Tax=Ilyodon furcidens TaxID=33524 RepID=A0ABV0TCY0_9TELE
MGVNESDLFFLGYTMGQMYPSSCPSFLLNSRGSAGSGILTPACLAPTTMIRSKLLKSPFICILMLPFNFSKSSKCLHALSCCDVIGHFTICRFKLRHCCT